MPVKKRAKPISGVELAKILGISHATVSYVLNGKAEARKISPSTIELVREAAKKHNCVPNLVARSLKTRNSGMIGVILGNLKMDWADLVLETMNDVLDTHPLVPFVATHAMLPERNRKELFSSLQRRDVGIITQPMPGCDDVYELFLDENIPVIFLGDELAAFDKKISSVTWDASLAIEAAIKHLYEQRRSRIAFLGADYPGQATLHRFSAFQRAVKKCALKLPKHWVASPQASGKPEAIANEALDQFFASKKEAPDAIFALNDGLALPALQALEERGKRVPQDVALVGMGDLPLSRIPMVGISTIPEPTAELAERSTRLMLDILDGKEKAPQRETVATDVFIPRRTTT